MLAGYLAHNLEARLDPEIFTRPIGGSRLARDYLSGAASVAPLYPARRDSWASWESQIRALDTQWSEVRRRSVIPLLRGRATQDRDRLERFCTDGGLVVSTGQQAGLLTGPLLTINKALTAVHLAERLERRTGRPVLPVFWIASEDHDWAEAATVRLLDAQHHTHVLRAQPLEAPAERPVHEVLVGPQDAVVASFRAACPGPGFSDDVVQQIEAAYGPDATLASGFEALLDSLLGDRGLFLVQAHDAQLKRLSVPVLTRALQQHDALASRLAERGTALREAGYHEQVTMQEGAALVFRHGPDGRQRILPSEHGTGSSGIDTLIQELDREPGAFSPGALLRPVVEASVFPVVAYAAGPGELAYSAQNGIAFEGLDVTRPILWPRVSATIVEPKAAKSLAWLGLEADEIDGLEHEVATRVARSRIPAEVHDSLDALKASVHGALQNLEGAALPIDPTLAGPLDEVARRLTHSVDKAERKVTQAIKRTHTEAMAQLARARAMLVPDGVPQERAVPVLYFLARYGPDLLEALSDAVAREVEVPADS